MIRSVTATVRFDPPIKSEEEAIQTLIEAACDDCAELRYERDDLQQP